VRVCAFVDPNATVFIKKCTDCKIILKSMFVKLLVEGNQIAPFSVHIPRSFRRH